MSDGSRNVECWRVLIADDDDDTRTLMGSALRRAGLSVLEASNGRELVELVQRESSARLLVISDIGMPELDGISAARAIRDSSPTIPIVLVTAFAEGYAIPASNSGARVILPKPLDMAVVVKTAVDLMSQDSGPS